MTLKDQMKYKIWFERILKPNDLLCKSIDQPFEFQTSLTMVGLLWHNELQSTCISSWMCTSVGSYDRKQVKAHLTWLCITCHGYSKLLEKQCEGRTLSNKGITVGNFNFIWLWGFAINVSYCLWSQASMFWFPFDKNKNNWKTD